MKRLTLGINRLDSKNVYIDIDELAVCLVVGGWASGKTIWLSELYEQIESNIECEYVYLDVNDSGGAPKPMQQGRIFRGNQQCLKALIELAELSEQRAKNIEPSTKHLVIHIEGHDLAYFNKDLYFSSLVKLSKNARKANISIVLVVPRFYPEEIPKGFIEASTLKAVFAGDTYNKNAKKMNLKTSNLDEFEKQIELDGSNIILKPTNYEA